jgi:alpha-galactosidase
MQVEGVEVLTYGGANCRNWRIQEEVEQDLQDQVLDQEHQEQLTLAVAEVEQVELLEDLVKLEDQAVQE